jgi:hypothetical protein
MADAKDAKENKPEGGRVLIRFNEEDTSQVNFDNLTQITVNGQPGTVFYKHPTPDHGVAIVTFFGENMKIGPAEPLPGVEEPPEVSQPDAKVPEDHEKIAAKR